MIPLKLTLSGFMSYREEQTLDFKDDSLWVLVGKNASGKSSIFDAVIFVLFGETRIKGIPNGELVNHHSDAAQITFDFAVGNKLYRAKRTIDKKGNATRQASVLLMKPDSSLAPQPIPLTHKEREFKNWIENDIGLNYEVFITSVLLRQGKADAFLEASTETRYDVLSKLIDLSKYVALEGKVREQKRFWDAQATFYRDNLSRISPVTEQDLADAQNAIERENDAVQATQRLVGKLQTLFGQASQWEHLNTDLLTTGARITNYESLLNRASEINNYYQRLIDLRRVLPSLKTVFDLSMTIRQEETEVQRLSSEWLTDDGVTKTNELTVGELGADYERRVGQAQKLSAESTRIYRRLNELSSVVSIISQVVQLEKDLEAHHTALTKYPDNLDELFKASEMERDQLLEAQQATPGLSRLTTERTELVEAEQRRLRLAQLLQEKKDAHPGILIAKEDAQADFEKAEAFEKSMRDALTEATTLLGLARKHMENFNQVAGAAKCQYCGSDLTENHKAQERERLASDLEEKSAMAEKAKDHHARAVEAMDQSKAQHRSTADNLTQLDAEISSTTRDIESCERDIRDRLAGIGMTYDALPSAYQVRVCTSKPINSDAWIETIYPQNSDLEELKAAVKRIKQSQADAVRLAEQVRDRDQRQDLWKSTSEKLNNTRGTLPLNWQELQGEHKSLSDSEEQIAGLLEAAQKEQSDANDALEKAKGELQEIRDRQTRRVGTLETTRATLQRNQNLLATQVAQLPECWQAEAGAMTKDKLDLLTAEIDELQEYEELHQQLVAVGQTL